MSKSIKSFANNVLPIILTLTTVTTLTVVSMLYAKGYRINFDNQSGLSEPTISVQQTGILAVRSIPDAAKIYINDELRDSTNATITGLETGAYKLRVEKEGYESWEKEIEVYRDLVTDVTALLVLRGGGLNPLTNTGVGEFEISNSGEILAFTSIVEEKPGLYQITLSGTPINIFQSAQKAIILDTPIFEYSQANKIYFSPDDQEILLEMDEETYYLVGVNQGIAQQPVLYTNSSSVFEKWDQKDLKNKISSADSLKVPQEIIDLATSKKAVWSPDGEKFYVVEEVQEGNETTYRVDVYNFEDPVPVGEQRFYNAVSFSEPETQVQWFSDSKHLLLVKSNNVELVNIDGGNKVNLYSGEIIGNKAFATPAGDKVIILTKIKEEAPENLYMISIR